MAVMKRDRPETPDWTGLSSGNPRGDSDGTNLSNILSPQPSSTLLQCLWGKEGLCQTSNLGGYNSCEVPPEYSLWPSSSLLMSPNSLSLTPCSWCWQPRWLCSYSCIWVHHGASNSRRHLSNKHIYLVLHPQILHICVSVFIFFLNLDFMKEKRKKRRKQSRGEADDWGGKMERFPFDLIAQISSNLFFSVSSNFTCPPPPKDFSSSLGLSNPG